MTILSNDILQSVFEKVKSAFADCLEFDSLIADRLKQAIYDSNFIDVNYKTTKKLAERYYDASQFQTREQKQLFGRIQLIFKCAYVLILTYHDEPQTLIWHSVKDLLEAYPEFCGVDEEELRYLLNFRNYLKVGLLLLPAHLNKDRLMKIAARLEGSQNPEYITGGGQKPEVDRRVKIYEKEGGIVARKRASKRKKSPLENNALSKSPSDLSGSMHSSHVHYDDIAAAVYTASDVTDWGMSSAQNSYVNQTNLNQNDFCALDTQFTAYGTSTYVPESTSNVIQDYNNHQMEMSSHIPAMPIPLSLPSPVLRSNSFINMFETGDLDPFLFGDEFEVSNSLCCSAQSQYSVELIQQPVAEEASSDEVSSPTKLGWVVR